MVTGTTAIIIAVASAVIPILAREFYPYFLAWINKDKAVKRYARRAEAEIAKAQKLVAKGANPDADK